MIYKRKSQEDKNRQILSLETQEDICNELVDLWKLSVKDRFKESKSAKVPDKRVHFNTMMKSIERGKVDVIVCWKIDRLVRNMKEGGWIIDLLQRNKLKAIITKEKIYLPEDNTIITAIEMASATEFSAELSRKVRDGNSKKIKKGMPNNYAVLGYLNNKRKEQGNRDWRDDPKRWKYLQRALHKILKENWTPHQAYLWLRNNIKLTTPKYKTQGGSLISQSAFYRFLKRTEISGFIIHKGEKIILNGCITPMITESEYWLLQKRLGKKGNFRVTKSVSTYSGYVTSPEGFCCSPGLVDRVTCDCKHKFSIKKKTVCPKCKLDINNMKSPIFYRRKYYYNNERKRQKLKAKGVPEELLDSVILKIAECISMDQDIILWSQNYINDMEDEEFKEQQSILEAQKEKLVQLKKRKDRLKNAFLDGVFSSEEYQIESDKIKDWELEHNITPEINTEWKNMLLSLIEIHSEILQIWRNGEIKQKRTVLNKLKPNFVWNEEKLSIITPEWLSILISGLMVVKAQKQQTEPKKNLIKQGVLQGSGKSFPTLCTMWDLIRTQLHHQNTVELYLDDLT